MRFFFLPSRIHAMKPELYEGEITFRVFDARSVTVFQGGIDDPIVPESTQMKPMEFTEDERQRVIQLRKWWREEARRTKARDSQGITQDMNEDASTIQPDLPFHINCQVLHVQPNYIIVTDGKKSSLNLLSHDQTLRPHRTELSIFGSTAEAVSLKNGEFVQIREIQCKATSFATENGHKLVCQFKNENIEPLSERLSVVKEMKKDIQRLKDSQEVDSITNDTLKDLFSSQISLDTQSQPSAVRVYPANLDGILIPGSDDEQSQDFYTCQEPNPERMSPRYVLFELSYILCRIQSNHGFRKSTAKSRAKFAQTLDYFL